MAKKSGKNGGLVIDREPRLKGMTLPEYCDELQLELDFAKAGLRRPRDDGDTENGE